MKILTSALLLLLALSSGVHAEGTPKWEPIKSKIGAQFYYRILERRADGLIEAQVKEICSTSVSGWKWPGCEGMASFVYSEVEFVGVPYARYRNEADFQDKSKGIRISIASYTLNCSAKTYSPTYWEYRNSRDEIVAITTDRPEKKGKFFKIANSEKSALDAAFPHICKK